MAVLKGWAPRTKHKLMESVSVRRSAWTLLTRLQPGYDASKVRPVTTHIQRTGYLLKFHPASLAMALWVDPHDRHLDSETIRALLTEGDSYVDVGANIGHLTIEATLVVGDTPRLLVAMMCPVGALRFWLDRRKTGVD